MQDIVCVSCGREANGYKCVKCGVEQDHFSEDHYCGEEHLMAKCVECGEVEVDCNCGF